MKSIFTTKSLQSVKETSNNGSLVRSLTYFDLIMLGIGAIIGTGIFVLTGIAAADHAGPAISVSFLLAGITCLFVAFVYAEVATMIPNSGSVYTYSYVALGEFFAWVVGWLMTLQFTISAGAVASGWSGYMMAFIKSMGVNFPEFLVKGYFEGGLVNLPAVAITLFLTAFLLRGVKESANLNNILVFIKLAAIVIFLVVGFSHFNIENWGANISEFMPFGFSGVAAGAATVFMAYNGFDALATTTEECKNPKRDVTIGILGSLIICTLLYMLVSGVLTGISSYQTLNNSEPVSNALRVHGHNSVASLIAIGAVAAMTNVILTQIYSQSRIFYVMARDGLLPEQFARLHPKFNTPYMSTIYIGIVIALLTGILPIKILAGLASMASLSVFIVACVTVIVLRIKLPNVERPFKCPAVFITAPLAIVSSLYLLCKLLFESKGGLTLQGAIFIGVIICAKIGYFLYPMKFSKLRKKAV